MAAVLPAAPEVAQWIETLGDVNISTLALGNPVNATKTSIGDAADLLSDSGSSVHCCGPHDFPDHDHYVLTDTKEFNAANGQPLRCTGYKNVTI